jgi:hypothetical protein
MQYELANVVNCFWLVVCCTCGRIVGPIISYIRRTSQINNPRSARVFSSVASIISRYSGKRKDFATLRVSDTVSQISIQVVRSLVLSTILLFPVNCETTVFLGALSVTVLSITKDIFVFHAITIRCKRRVKNCKFQFDISDS